MPGSIIGSAAQDAVSIQDAKAASEATEPPNWLDALRQLVDPDQIRADFQSRLDYSRDRIPLGRFRHRSKQLTATVPSAVVEAGSAEEVSRIVKFATAQNIPVIPYGAGSGVLGGTVPLNGELIIALSRLNRIIDIDEENFLVRVEAGTNGGELESELRRKGFTSGHYPQSLEMSTVGGWAACRGSGQASTRYGNIENMVVGMKVVLPDGELLEVKPVPRRSVGPNFNELFIGSEGVFGIIVELVMKIWRLPEHEVEAVMAFATTDDGLGAVRDIMQAELRPSLARLYDETESENWNRGGSATDGLPVVCMLQFVGPLAAAEAAVALDLCSKRGGIQIDDTSLKRWKGVRFKSHSEELINSGSFYDTIEIAASWTVLPDMYSQIRSAVTARHPVVQLSAHWSHAYSDGACMYMTVKFPPMEDDLGLQIHADVWEAAMTICLQLNGTISHHHGIGYFRNAWIAEELNAGHGILRQLKRSLDPNFLFNPNKLALGNEA
jgi:alkyldihydroxyacetonephosphate synthase